MTGRVLSAVRRIWYVLDGDITSNARPIELTFRDGSTVGLDAGSDGEKLAVRNTPWQDPFREPLTRKNHDYVEKSGKWTAFDVSSKFPYDRLIGLPVVAVEPLVTPSGKIYGATMRTVAGAIRAEVAADELWVDVDSIDSGDGSRAADAH
jgi:hypothetical protein